MRKPSQLTRREARTSTTQVDRFTTQWGIRPRFMAPGAEIDIAVVS